MALGDELVTEVSLWETALGSQKGMTPLKIPATAAKIQQLSGDKVISGQEEWFGVPPSTEEDVAVWMEGGIPQSLVSFVGRTHMGARALGLNLLQLKEESDGVTTAIATDLQELLFTVLKFKASIGVPKRLESSGGSLWESVERLFSSTMTVDEMFRGADSKIKASTSLFDSMQVPLKRVYVFMQRFCGEGELVGEGLTVGAALEAKLIDIGSRGETGLHDGLLADLHALRDRVDSLEGRSAVDLPSNTLEGGDITELLVHVDGLAGEMRLMESRMRGEGYVLADNTFLSQLDTETWCRTFFANGHFEYVVDAVSLFAYMPTLKYKTANEDLDKKSKAKRLGLTSSQGNLLASLHNVLPEIFGSMGDDPSVPIPNLKTRHKWWSRGGTAGVSKVLRDNLVKAKKAVREGIHPQLQV